MALDAQDSARDVVPDSHQEAEEPSLGQLFVSATRDIQSIVRDEVKLASAEIQVTLAHVKKGAPLLGVAAVLGLFGLGFLLNALAQGLVALGLASWLAYLIVAVLLFVVAAILGLVGRGAVSQIQPKPERAIANAQATISTLKRRG
ncbi:MAG: phage holin family protein [Lapillicoccus sp.]